MLHLKHNIPLMYIIACLSWARFFIPVLALFYIASQVPLEQFAIIMGAFALSNFLLEIPTGIIADIIGRKKTLVIGRFMYIIEVFILAFMNGFWPFLIAKIISGVGVSFVSGASEALLYDTLKKLRIEKEHKRISGTMFTLTNISMAFVFIIGAYLFSIDSKLPAIASLPTIILAFALTCLLQEPYKSQQKLTLKNSLLQLKEGLLCVWKHQIIKYLILFSMAGYAILDVVVSMSSAYAEQILIPVALIGVVAFAASMTTALVSKNVHSFEAKIGDRKSMLLIQILLIAGLFLMSFLVPYYGVIFYFFIPVASGFFHVLTNHYMNVHVDTKHRATILSIKHMCSQLITFLLYPLFGFLTKIYSMKTAFLSFSIILLAYALILLHPLLQIKLGELNKR
ncbi:MAG: MFS transporter [Candidatus Aenigmarchaeota archaeon]|nr:MFS transporter [Candidatus Aenigmarchaeota archaeon]